MERVKRAVSLVLCFVMVLGMLPTNVFAVTADDSLTAALTEAREYIDSITVNNSSNDPETVVKNFKTHFTWDNEKRENGKSYLFDWSYYNGVVFEGLEYLYEVTKDEQYKDYVVEYMSSLIAADGTWAKCTNSGYTSNECAGYVDYHGADCYKTASLLLDAYDMTNDQRYLTMAETLYEDLDDAAEDYLLDEAGYNYRHLWAGDTGSDIDLWLDGLYMILPFRAEYARYIGDTEELDLIVDRLTWVSENMYNDDGLFYHAADSATSNSGTYWLRSIGWYAAAIADVMDSVSESDRAVLAEQLEKLADGLWDRQSEIGMWQNDLSTAQSSSNPYETSGTALVCYAVMKAVNNGWLEEAYAEMAIKAFKGICENKLENNNLTDICFKGVPGGSNSTYYDNEGKGVGPFIMLTAEVQEYVNNLPAEEEPSEPEETVLSDLRVSYSKEALLGEKLVLTVTAVYSDGTTKVLSEDEYTVEGYDPNATGAQGVIVTYENQSRGFTVVTNAECGVTVLADGMSSLTVKDVTADEAVAAAMNTVKTNGFVAYDITPDSYSTASNNAIVAVNVPADWEVGTLVAYYIDADGKIAETIPAEYANGKAVFTTSHFSTYAVANDPAPAAETGSNYGEGNLVGGKVYTLDTDGVTAGKDYLIVNTASSTSGYALTNNNGTAGRTDVSISGSGTNRTITVEDDTNIAWQFSGSTSGTVGNNGRYVYPNNGSLTLNEDGSNMTISNQGNGAYRIYRTASNYNYFLRYNNGWTATRERTWSSTAYSVYLYELTSSSAGEAVTFTITPASVSFAPDGKATLTGTVTVGGKEVGLENCTINWASEKASVATVDNGTVTGVADGTTNITATLSAVNGTALQENIVLTIPVTVASKTAVSGVLSGNSPVSTKVNVQPDFSNIKLTVTYDDGTTGVITVDNDLIITGYDITKPGVYIATISYGNLVIENNTVRVTVEGNPFEGLENATEYPEYPADGAVRIDKTAAELDFDTTGLVEVELDVAGVSVKSAVDVILVADISNSMAWRVGSTTGSDADKIATSSETDKWDALQDSAAKFIDILLKANKDGSPTSNTVSFVTFGGFDAQRNANTYSSNADAVQTHFTSENDAENAKTIINKIEITGNTSNSSYTISGMASGNGTAQGGTNYDFAFMETAAAIKQLKADYAAANNSASYDNSGRTIYVVFMTDGAPDHYNQLYYKTRSTSQFDYYALYINDDDIANGFTNYTTNAPTVQGYNSTLVRHTTNGYYMPNSTNFTQAQWENWLAADSNAAAEKVLDIAGVNSITAIGFDLAGGGFGGWTFGIDVLEPVLKNLAGTNSCDVFTADSTAELNAFYESLATKIRYAGTSAQASDVIDSDFTLQMGNTTGTKDKGAGEIDITAKGYTPSISIKTYDLVTKADLGKKVAVNDLSTVVTEEMVDKTYTVDGKELKITTEHVGKTILLDNQEVTVTEAHLGMRKATAVTVIETVTFNADGTEAYIRTGSGTTEDPYVYSDNIMTKDADGNVTINATYFTYTNIDGVESFKWNIGNITDKEIALSFMAYLKGSLEGEEANGLKYTNEEAILEYVDINGDYAKQIFPVPAVAWGGASTAYEFYLVNHNGEPCDRDGNVIPFPNRIIITGPYYEELYLNQGDENVAKDIIAAYVLPAGYTLYDETAKYTVQTASGDNEGYLKIKEPGYGLIATDEDYNGQRYRKVENQDGTVEYVADNDGAYKKITKQTTIPVSAVTPTYIQSRVAFGVVYNMIPTVSKFKITPDQVVIDYGKSITINVNDNNTDVPVGTTATLIGFSRFYEDVNPEQQFSNTSSLPVYDGTYGTFTIDADNNVVYTPHKFVDSVGKIFCHYKITTTGNDTYYMVSELDVIPATIVYYETDFATGVFTTATTGEAWTTESKGDAADGPQNDGTIGQNTYGFDTTYNNDAFLSNGSSLFAKGMGYQDTTVTFSFTGTGFDLISRTGAAQGLIKVEVATDAKMTNIVKTVSVLNKSESNLELYQIPVVSINDLPHTTYYVKIGVNKEYVAPSEALASLNRGNEFYFDAIRVYDPAKGNTIAEAAYNADGEANSSIDEVRAQLLNAETYATITGTTTGMVFVDNQYSGSDTAGVSGDVTVATYEAIGPNNEVYLNKGQAVAFKVDANSIPASFDIGAKSIKGDTAGLQVTIVKNDRTTVAWTDTASIASSTVQYINLLDAAGADASLLYQGAYVVITNTGDGVLSITDLKTAFSVSASSVAETASMADPNAISVASVMTTAAYDPFAVNFTVDSNTLDVAKSVLTAAPEPEVPETPEEPEVPETPEEPEVDTSAYDILHASIKVNGNKKNRKITITVITTQEVEDIEVSQDSREIKPSKITYKDKRRDGTRVWTIVLTSRAFERLNTYTLVGIGENGVQGEAVTVSNHR